MSNDLISRSDLMDRLRWNVLVDVTPELEKAIQDQPTADDVEKVMKRSDDYYFCEDDKKELISLLQEAAEEIQDILQNIYGYETDLTERLYCKINEIEQSSVIKMSDESDDLISRRALIETLKKSEDEYKAKIAIENLEDDAFSDGILSALFSVSKMVNSQPIAYDAEKVVAQLESEKHEVIDCEYDEGVNDMCDTAIKIVKAGGLYRKKETA